MAKSLLYQNTSPFEVPPGCGLCDRQQIPVTLRKDGRLYRFILRDKITVDDIYIVGVKAAAFAIQQDEPYAGTPVDRNVKDFLIKTDSII